MRSHIVVLTVVSLVAGCSDATRVPGGDGSPSSTKILEYPIRATATVGMVADIVRNVGCEHVAVTQIMGAGVDPHLYKATRDDVQTLLEYDIVFYSGLMLEGKMSDTLVKVARNKPVFAVTELIDESGLLEPEDFQGHYDPHVWMDVAT